MLICILQLKSLTVKFVLSINLPFGGVCLFNDGSFIIVLRDNLLVCLTSSSIGLSSKACLNESSLHLASALAGIYVIPSMKMESIPYLMTHMFFYFTIVAPLAMVL